MSEEGRREGRRLREFGRGNSGQQPCPRAQENRGGSETRRALDTKLPVYHAFFVVCGGFARKKCGDLCYETLMVEEARGGSGQSALQSWEKQPSLLLVLLSTMTPFNK